MKQPVCGVGAIAVRDRAILLIKRDKEPARGRWSLPGGRVNVGETLNEAIIREVREETGLDIDVDGMCGIAERIERDDAGEVKYHYVIIDFYATVRGGELSAGDDAADARWVPVSELADYALTDGLIEFLTDRGIIATGRARVGR